ncbi:MAG: sortase [Nocardioidaceae bacterium]
MTTTELPTRRPLRRTLRGTGLVLMVAGLAILGYVGWQLFGTTWVSHREQHRIIDATERVWAGGKTSAKDVELAKGVVALVRIPALGKDYVVPAHRGTDDATLSKGFGVFGTSPEPGGRGNFALAGHRITHGEPLRGMPGLEAGDQVLVQTRDTTYTYVLDTDGDALTVDMDAGWVTEDNPVDPRTGRDTASQAGSRRLLTLVTCAELFHTDNRLVAFGHLVSEEPTGG